MKKLLLIIITLFLTNCNFEKPTEFSEEALNDSLITLDGDKILFKSILNKYKGKKVVIDIWASWCRDCIKGLPKVTKLQKEHPEAAYVFLSLDRNTTEWKNGIQKYHVQGDHYFLKSGYEGNFGSFVNIDWIPRYMVIDEQGKIALFKAVKANDLRIMESLKNTVILQ